MSRRVGTATVVALAAAAILVAVAPDPVPLGGARLWARVALVAGVSVVVARTRAVDLSVGAVAGVGAVVGGVVPALLGAPAVLGLPLGAAAGATLGAIAGAVQGRVGRQLGALATLAIGGAVVAVLGAVDATGGVVGFHAVGLPTGAGDRWDALAVGAVAIGVLVGAVRLGGLRSAAGAAVAVADPAVAASLGRRPARDAALVGACGGALTGIGGALLASVDGSVVPAAYGLELTAALVVAAAVGGPGVLGPVVGAGLVWGPATLVPLVPIVGTWPVLVTTGVVALVVLARRGGRGLTSAGPTTELAAAGTSDRAEPAPADVDEARPPVLRLRGTPTPAGPVDLEVARGRIVAIVGPNGAGKSTLLARIGGQLPDHGTVELDGHRAPRGPRRRAHLGVARTWQRAPAVPGADAHHLAVVLAASTGRSEPGTGAGVTAQLGATSGSRGGRDLERVVAAAPRVALLDEPTDVPVERLVEVLLALARRGTTVLVVDHRPQVAAAADQVVHLGPEAVP